MKAAIFLTVVLSLGCASASPTFGAISQSQSVEASSSASSSFVSSSSSSSSSSFNYYSSDVCTAVGFSIRDDLPTCIFDELEQQFLQKKCELLNSYGVYPKDIGPHFCDLQPDSLNYDIILVGSGPAGLSSLSTLSALGKRILIVDKGYFPPAAADSLYYRSSLYASEYVNSFEGYINGEITKNLYTSNVFGGLSVLDTNSWNIGSRLLYEQLSQIDDEFCWDNIYNYYKSLECYKSYEKTVSVTKSSSSSSSSSSSVSADNYGSSSGSSYSSSTQETTTSTTSYSYEYSTSGTYSIYNTFKDSYLTRTLSSVFDELGYCNNASPFDLSPNKYCILPVLGDAERPTLFPHTVFNAIEQYKDNIDLALRTTANRIIFEGKRASGIEVVTPSGQTITLYARDQVILSTGPISTYQLLFNSGCGPENLLNQFNIPINFPIPYMGNGLISSPIYHGLCLKFPKGYLMNDCDSDLRNLAYAFGDYELSSTLSLNYYRAYLAVKGATEANVSLKFYAFGQSTSIRLKSMMSSYFQYDSYTQEYINSLINDYDILIIGAQLLNPRSRGSIYYKDCIDKPYIDLGMYSDNYDTECLFEAIEQARALASTQAFTSLQGELVQFPLQNCNGDFFTQEFNKQSILYHSIPSLYNAGAFPIGLDYQSAVVDKALRVLGTENLRLFSPCVSPYPLYSDSLAFSTFMGSYGAKIISDEYNGKIIDFISTSSGSSISTNFESSSYSSRDVDISSSYSSTDINSGINLDGSVSQYSSNSNSVSSNYSENNVSSSSTSFNGDCLDGDANFSKSEYNASSSNSSYEANSISSNSGVIGAGGVGSVNQQSSSSSFSAQNESSNVSSSSYSDGLGGVKASNFEASSQSSSVSAQQQSSSYSSDVGVLC